MGRKKRKYKRIDNLRVTGGADRGKVVARTPEGEVVFIDEAAPGDLVDVQVYKRRKGANFARVVETHEYSKGRVEPFCEHFEVCGGCKWQHIGYPLQLEMKQEITENAIRRIGRVTVPEQQSILGADPTRRYRNKLEFSFSNRRWLTAEEINTDISNRQDVVGFHAAGTFDKIIDITECHLMPEPQNAIRNFVRDYAHEQGLSFYDIRENKGYLRHLTVRITTIGEVMLLFSLGYEDREVQTALFDAVLSRFPEVTSLNYVINRKVNDFTLDLPHVNYHGRDHIFEQFGDIRYKIGTKSFFQTNSTQGKRLYDLVAEMADLSGTENVYDLYTGTGSIACYLAPHARQVVGIEEIESAITDARYNAEINDLQNTVFYAGDVRAILTDDFADKHGKPDLVVTDPPRAGMHADVVQMLLTLAAPRIVYVSCKPATQARDLQLLSEKYDVVKMRPVDMFPHTHHIENVVLLELRL